MIKEHIEEDVEVRDDDEEEEEEEEDVQMDKHQLEQQQQQQQQFLKNRGFVMPNGKLPLPLDLMPGGGPPPGFPPPPPLLNLEFLKVKMARPSRQTPLFFVLLFMFEIYLFCPVSRFFHIFLTSFGN